jgi:hypothetical protein
VVALGEAEVDGWELGSSVAVMPKAEEAAHSTPGVAGWTPGFVGRGLFAFG